MCRRPTPRASLVWPKERYRVYNPIGQNVNPGSIAEESVGVPRKPGCPFDDIWGLVQQNKSMLVTTGISPELVIGIFWEETLFNNVFQTAPGTAVGYGQVEPAEFYRFNFNNVNSRDKSFADLARNAQAKGYAVFGLPRVIYNPGNRVTCGGPLTDEQSVQVALAMIRDLRERGKGPHTILNGYAGIGFKGEQAAHLARPGGREAIIRDWHECETRLQAAIPADDQDGIMQALKQARPFKQDDEFRAFLFPG